MTQNSTPGLDLDIRKEPGCESEDKGHVSDSGINYYPQLPRVGESSTGKGCFLNAGL